MRWSQTQDETITEQLNQGIRFVDLQVAYNGNGSADTGWRVVASEYSDFPLYDYLDQIANWANAHPTEVVVVDLSRVCYDDGATGSIDDGLWSNFSTRSNIESSPTTIAQVAFNPANAHGSLANATIDEIAKPGHNAVILVPSNVIDLAQLTTTYHVHPIVTKAASDAAAGSSSTLDLEFADAQVAPESVSEYVSSDSELESFPLSTTPSLGSLLGRGLYVSQVAYSVTDNARQVLFKRFGGLITSASVGTHPAKVLVPWEVNLWSGARPRNVILAAWGHRANVVLSDGVEYGGFIQAVISLNAR